jgi:uroporphyrinogen-III synthase
MMPEPDLKPLAGWSVVCLRPSAQQAAVRRAVIARGGRHVSLPGLRLVPAIDARAARDALRNALDCSVIVFTSPAAVTFAAHLLPLRDLRRQTTIAVGEGTAMALARHGVPALMPPPDAMHSDGVLALPQWHQVAGPVGLVTAPGGRGVIAAGLTARGLEMRRAEVYQRLPPRLDARHLRALEHVPAPRAVLVSSAEALELALAALPEALRTHLLDATAVASSPRLAELARDRGFAGVLVASAPTASAMLDALVGHVGAAGFR